MLLTNSRRALTGLATAAALSMAITACGVDRSGTLAGGITTYLNSCSGAAGTTEVSWSGVNAASLRVTYRRGTSNKTSPWTAAPGTSTGTVSVAVPASAATAEWSVHKVEYATAASGGGTRTNSAVDCATAVTTTVAPVSSKPIETAPPSDSVPAQALPPETVAPLGCSSAPVNSEVPTIVADPNSTAFLILASEGAWSTASDCTISSTGYSWEVDTYNQGRFEPANYYSTFVRTFCGGTYRIVVTKTNEFGSTSATSAVHSGRC